jgi:hypothetical protein
MDKPIESRGPDTSQIELTKILEWLIKHGYKNEGTGDVYHPRYIFPNDAVTHFEKEIDYTDITGNYINDSKMIVSIQFEKRADYKHKEEDEDGEPIYDREPHEFIEELIDSIKDKQRKINKLTRLVKIQKKQRKTSKNHTRKTHNSI